MEKHKLSAELQPGDLHHRLHANFDRLERDDYAPANLFLRDAAGGWPGDTVGRTLLAWSCLAQVTQRGARYLSQVLAGLQGQMNARGYLGPEQTSLDEQQLAGHGWLVSGLLQAYALSGDTVLLQRAEQIVDSLFMPVRGRMSTYPRNPTDRIVAGQPAGTHVTTMSGWSISSDTGCVYIALEGLVKAHAIFRRPQEQELIEEMLDSFRSMDIVAISAQLHASLTATRQLLAYADLAPEHNGLLQHAQYVYGLFREQAITENYANYNWFNRPTWTEPCAVVDAFIISLQLWRKTGQLHYLDDAHHIYYNALGYAQKPHGGFGLENCVGAATDNGQTPAGADISVIYNLTYDVWWCCNMRGAVGLATAARWAYLLDQEEAQDQITLPFYFNSRIDVPLASGTLRIEQNTDYPGAGSTVLRILSTDSRQPVKVRLYIPGWVQQDTVTLTVNTQPEHYELINGFAEVTRIWERGDQLHLAFPIDDRIEPLVVLSHMPGRHTHRHGPLILGRTMAGTLTPLNDVINLGDEAAQSDRRQILFI